METTTAISPTAAKDYARLRRNAAACTDAELLEVVTRNEGRRPTAAVRRCLEVYITEAARRGLVA